MSKTTKVIEIISEAVHPHQIDNAKLIQARVDQHIRPNLDLITLPKLGDLGCLCSYWGSVEQPISGRCVPGSAVQTSDLLKERGIFQVYDHPSAHIGHTCTFQAWGLNKNARWLQIELDVWKQRSKNNGWEEILLGLRTREVSLDELLTCMKSSQHGKRDGWVWTHDDKDGASHYIVSNPGIIWHALTTFILKWHQEQRKRYIRSKRFAENILFEDLTVETFSKSFR